jgi:pyruvate dehydrogenase (quinone)
VTVGAVGEIKASLQALLPRLQQHEDNAFLEGHLRRRQKDVAAARAETASGLNAISGTYLTKVINRYAAEDALFSADDGTAGGVDASPHRDRRQAPNLRQPASRHNGGRDAFGAWTPEEPTRATGHLLAGDGGFAMLPGDLLTVIREDLPIKIAVYDNGKLGFVDIEQKAAGLVPVYTDLKNPDFGEVARAVGLWGHQVSKAGELDNAVQTWLRQPGPALLHVKVKPMQLVTPPSPFVSPEAVVGMAVYTAKRDAAGQGSRRLGNGCRQYPLVIPCGTRALLWFGSFSQRTQRESAGSSASWGRTPSPIPWLVGQGALKEIALTWSTRLKFQSARPAAAQSEIEPASSRIGGIRAERLDLC